MDFLKLFHRKYNEILVPGFDSKFLPYLKLKNYLDLKFPDKKFLGNSFLGNEIYSLKKGRGSKKILIWSQMHGNESTGTRAMLDVFEFLNLDEENIEKLLNEVTIYFIPMLNPDGATTYTRRNAVGIDLNRDFISESSPEIRILKNYVHEIQPDFIFNLHDQRSIFNVNNTPKSATLSFLAPSPDLERSVTEARLKSMTIIGKIAKTLETLIPGQIARFSDEFYPTSTGDNFMKAGFSNLLFEAGHFPNDYARSETRKYNALAILLAMEAIAIPQKPNAADYFKIPENNKKSLDVILRNVAVKCGTQESLIDIGIYFEEHLNLEKQEIDLVSKIEETGDLSGWFGHLDLDMKGAEYDGNSELYPKLGQSADFKVGKIQFENGKFIR